MTGKTARQEIAKSIDYINYLASLRGAHDPAVYYENSAKLLGSWIVEPADYLFDYAAPDVKWTSDDTYMNIYLPPTGADHLSLSDLRQSHHLLAKYMVNTGLVAETRMNICAITSHKLARVVMRAFGFKSADLPPDTLAELAEEGDARGIYERHVKTKEPFSPVFVYQTPEQYLGHYANTDPELAQYATDLRRLPDAFTTLRFGLGDEVVFEERWTKDDARHDGTVLY